jgi:hypothetical protein
MPWCSRVRVLIGITLLQASHQVSVPAVLAHGWQQLKQWSVRQQWQQWQLRRLQQLRTMSDVAVATAAMVAGVVARGVAAAEMAAALAGVTASITPVPWVVALVASTVQQYSHC